MNMKKKLDRKYMQISLYVIATCIAIYVLSLVAKNAPVILSGLMVKLGQFYRIIKPIVFGFIFAYILNGVVNFFEVKLKKLKPFRKKQSTRGLAVLVTFVLVALFFGFLITLVVYSVTDQIRLANFDDIIVLINGYSSSIKEFVEMLTEKLNSLNIQSAEIKQIIGNVSSVLMNAASNFINGAAGSVSSITSVLGTFFFSVIICIYFLIDGDMVKRNLRKISHAIFSDRFNERMKTLIEDADTVFSGYMKGQLMDAIVMMFLIGITLSIVGVKFAVIIGIIAGIGNLIPYCGPFIAYGASALVCLINGDIKKLIIAIVALLIIQGIDGNIIGPKLLSQSIEVHPLLVIISLIIGSSIGGLFGMLLAVPVGALIKVIFMRWIDHRIATKEAIRKIKASE